MTVTASPVEPTLVLTREDNDHSPPATRTPPRVLLLWFVAAVVLFAALGAPPVRRTQEARVLLTAREMVVSHDGARAWLVPHLNGRIRLEKPPLAYWLAAASMKLFGVNESAGRLPTAIAGWLTLGVVYAFARRLFDPRTALLAAAALLSSYMFFRHSRLAETDALATLFVTAAVYLLWRFTKAEARPRRFALAHSAAAMIALAILAKGPPAGFALLFFIAYALVARRPRGVDGWLLTGAPLTAAIIALPWFAYIRTLPEWPIVSKELAIALRGQAHRGPFTIYLPHVLRAVAPWCAVMVLGLVIAIASWKRDPRVRVVLIWAAAIFLPLCVAGQKQPHYLVPLVPPLAMLVAWTISRAIDAGATKEIAWVRGMFAATCIALAVAAIAVPIVGGKMRGNLAPIDFVLAILLVAAGIVALLALRRHGLFGAAVALSAGAAVMFVPLVGWWESSLVNETPRTVATTLRQHFGDNAAYWYYGENQSLPLAWSLRALVRQAITPEELTEAAAREPGLVAIAQYKHNVAPPAPPAGFVEPIAPIPAEDQEFHFYMREDRGNRSQ